MSGDPPSVFPAREITVRRWKHKAQLLKCVVGLHDWRYVERLGPRYCPTCGLKEYLTSTGWKP